MNLIWSKNYSAFSQRFPQLAKMLGTCQGEIKTLVPEWELVESKNGQITVSEKGIRLHSAYNPQREAAGAVSGSEVASKSTTVFYGFGLGYHLIEWAKLYASTEKKLVIIEPDVNRFFASMNMLDWTEVFKINQLVVAIGCPPESVLQLIENGDKVNIGETGVSDAFYFDIPAFTQHAQSYFEIVKSLIKRNQRKNEINAATLKKFGKLWCRNSLKNLKYLNCCSGIEGLKNKASENLPFLIIGAGPSLEKLLPHLKTINQKCIIVCVETALRALLRWGIQPDFIILTDPQFWAYKHIGGLKALSSTLITEISTYPAVFRFPCKNIMLCGSQFPVGQYFEQKLNLSLGDLGTGGSVASSAWNFAYFCGAKKIYVCGLDFAFPKKQTHIKGSSAEQTYHTVSNRIAGAEKFTAGTLYSANAVLSKDYTGSPVLTDSRMKMFSWWFESRLAACPEVVTYTLSPEGLCTPGMKPVEIEALLNEADCAAEKLNFMSQIQRTELSEAQKNRLGELEKSFPQEEFLNQYPFLAPYIK